jgi:DNA polymerase-3 subunit alpha
MYNIETKIELKKGEYLNLKLEDNLILFLKGEKVISKEKIKNEKIFKNRKLKGVVKEKKGNKYEIQVVRFADLHRHSGYSLLDGGSKIEDLVEKTEYVGALTDHGNMFGFLKYYKAMKEANKQPIVGFEAYSENIEGKKEGNHLVLLAKNKQGYKNLIKLTSLSYENFYKKPHVNYEMLKKYNEGIIALSACLGGEIPRKVVNNYEKAKEVAKEYKRIFGDDFYIEIQKHNIGKKEDEVNKGLIKLANELQIKIVATTDSHYVKSEDDKFHEMLLALSTGKTLSDESRMKFEGDGYHIHSADDMDKRFGFIPEAIDNTLEIAEKCANFELELGNMHFPKFEIPKRFTEESYFEHLVWEGFKGRFKDNSKIFNSEEYRKRLKREINTIKNMGYSAYFLIVWDFIKFAKDNNIMVGPGRGSAAGSLVSYCLNITDLNPMPYGLLFERFLNPERVSLPDIDVDFCYERRGEVIDYVRKKYGEDAVSGIATFGTFAARMSIRDVTRVMELPYALGDKIAKLIPEKPGITINAALEESPELQELYNQNEDGRRIINGALKIEGLPRHSSTHACGIVISDTTVDNYMPEFMAGNKDSGEKEITTQVNMSEVEELGLLKFDFLGLKTMSIIGRSIEQINKKTNQNIKYLDIPITNPYIYKYISEGKTQGVFQLESQGMRSFMKELFSDVSYLIKRIEKKYNLQGYSEIKEDGKQEIKYKKEMNQLGQELFERLIAGVSLYRPGPLDYIPNYLQGIKDPNKITYLTPELEPILNSTYGTIIYQEQVMQIVQSLAGYSLGRADIVRRAMGKKKLAVMEKEKEYFIHGKLNEDGTIDVPGCLRNGIEEEIAEEIWGQMADFSKYAFNKSHAAVYAMLGAITSWLKKYYPSIFMAETMNIFSGDTDKLRMYLHVTNEMGIKILPPSLNTSNTDFLSNGNDIMFGLGAIKFMGENADFIINERNARGKFEDMEDFIERMISYQKINKRAIEGLIFSGALDEFEGNRASKVKAAEEMTKILRKNTKKRSLDQLSLWDSNPDLKIKYKMPKEKPFQKRFKLEKEKEFAGFYITEHPLDEIIPYLKDKNITDISDLIEEVGEEGEEKISVDSFDGKTVDIVGIITETKTYYTKKTGEPLKVFQIEDKSGTIKGVMFNNNLEQFGEHIREGKIVYLSGTIKEDDFGRQIIVDSVKDVKSIKMEKTETVLYLKPINKKQIKDFKEKVLDAKKYAGKEAVYMTYKGKTLKSNKNINIKLVSANILRKIFHDSNYKIEERTR